MPQQNKPSEAVCFIGMLSGTSRDGADLALVSFEDEHPRIISTLCIPYPDPLADSLRNLIERGQRPEIDELESLNRALGEFFAAGVHQLLNDIGVIYKKVRAIGSHGQTVWHNPPESIQLGDPQVIANKTGIVTVGDFRRADLEAGGEGAPLAPLLHRDLFRPQQGQRGILNLGGIANLTLLDSRGNVSGFDTGPGNCLLDSWIRRHKGEAYDADGRWAAQGTVIQPLLMTLLEDPWFSRLPPKSTGVEFFNLNWLDQKVGLEAFPAEDLQATLAEFTARTVVDAIPENVNEVLVCGGGVHNSDLLRRLRENRAGCRFESTESNGIDPDSVEAMLFAWMARERINEQTQDTTSITGASQPVLLGSIYRPMTGD